MRRARTIRLTRGAAAPRALAALVVATLGGAWAGCLDTAPPEGVFVCSPETVDTDCPSGWFCHDGTCSRTPGTDDDAGTPRDAAIRHDAGPCAADSDCDDGDACTDDACHAGVCTNTPRTCAPAGPHTVGICADGSCTATCEEGYFDLDGDLSGNGCEYACTFIDAQDLPDDGAVDANCDGVDGVIGESIYVKPGGASDGDGRSPATAVGLEHAIALIQTASGPVSVLFAGGDYEARTPIRLQRSFVMVGGFSDDFRGRSVDPSRIVTDDASAVEVVRVPGAIVALSLATTNRTARGAWTATLWTEGSSDLLVRDVELLAGRGGDARSADTGSGGTMGATGAPGQNATPTGYGAAGAGAGGGGRGGSGGTPGSQGSAGAPVTPGGCGEGGSGGSSAARDGANGSSGCDNHELGVAGFAGVASAGRIISSSGWAPSDGAAGAAGDVGSPGGIGGGGGGGAGTSCVPTGGGPTIQNFGGGGGRGGAGGGGGAGGAGGASGGASIAILSLSSAIRFEGTVRVTVVGGGAGGQGGYGGVGGLGGAGGSGGSGSTNTGCGAGGSGGQGGQGGRGGRGGCGGGGAGGPSLGVFASGGSLSGTDAIQFSIGAGGAAGPRCTDPSGLPGSVGLQAEIQGP